MNASGGFWSESITYRTPAALDLPCVLEDTRRDLEIAPIWTTLVVPVSGQEAILLDKLSP